jgi:Protein of unknown function (DUF4238)
MANRSRKHHYLAKFQLAHFTHSGDAHGDLYVFDLADVRAWKSSPEQAANQRDYYAVDLGPNEDPSAMEHILGRLEGECSRVLREIVEQERLPRGYDFDCLLNFVALTIVRIPRTRTLVSHLTDEFFKYHLRGALASPDGWQQFRQVLGSQGRQIRDDECDVYRQFALGGDYKVDLDRTSHVQMMVQMIDPLLRALAARHWSLGIAGEDAPDLIYSDAPVTGWPTRHADSATPVTLNSPNTVLSFPISRRLIVLATFEKRPTILEVNQQGIAGFNTFTATRARQIFTASPEFTYLARDKTISKLDLLQFLRKQQRARN